MHPTCRPTSPMTSGEHPEIFGGGPEEVTRMPNTLIGRSEEVLAIDRTLSGLGRGGSAAIEVAGEPGIGKTRLLAELATRADALGYLVLSGSASELDADLPFWVFVDALDEYIAALEPRRLDAL